MLKTETHPAPPLHESIQTAGSIEKIRGLIFDVQGHSVHDGPGTRTTVFMSGCPLHCVWCCNPEGLFHHPVMMHKDSKCVCCGSCLKACPKGAVSIGSDGRLEFDRAICDRCESFECVSACLHEANEISGVSYSIDDMMKIFQRDRQFWGSRGGVTFSGGEPLNQKNFILPLLKRCKESYIHVCIETTAHLPSNYFQEALRYVDWVFTDIKHFDPDEHKRLCGVDNRLILRNIRWLAESGWDGFVVPRIPVIPGVNDGEDNIRATARFVKDIDLEVINILPFHRLGESKYRQLGQSYRFAEQKPPERDRMEHLKSIIESEGLVCFIGYETPF